MGRPSTGCNRFRPLVSGGGSSIDQREGAPCGGVRPPIFPANIVQLHGGSVCGQFHSSGLSPPPTACYLVVVVGLVRCEEGLGNGSGVVICPGRFNHATTASSEHPD